MPTSFASEVLFWAAARVDEWRQPVLITLSVLFIVCIWWAYEVYTRDD